MRPAFFLLILFAFSVVGCSSSNSNPLTPQSDISPAISDVASALGMLGAYELVIHPETMAADLVSKRISAIGEDYIVSGIAFFTVAPCPDCLKVKGIALDVDGNVILTFTIKHPFEPGTGDVPSAMNRLDLDVFDVAMVIHPTGDPAPTPTTYGLTGVDVYTGFCVNPDGYTRELNEVLTITAALPYFLAVDDSKDAIPPVSTFNELAMGGETTFDVGFDLSSGFLRFDMYLTMGYGFSAVKSGRLVPKYYNPEFNRKAAWKVVVTPPGGTAPAMGNTWDDSNNTELFNVSVEVYDWQQGATVSTEEDFGNADSGHVFAASEVASVSVEIPGMNPTPLPSLTTATSGDGTPSVPLVFDIPVANANGLGAGEYIGLVSVLDSRIPSTDWVEDGRDYLIDTPDGVQLDMYLMPEYMTYQTFIATVVMGGLQPVGDLSVVAINRGEASADSELCTSIDLDWNDISGAVEYLIERSDGYVATTWTEIGISTTSDYKFEPSGDERDDDMRFRVIARSVIGGDPGSDSDPSEEVFVLFMSNAGMTSGDEWLFFEQGSSDFQFHTSSGDNWDCDGWPPSGSPWPKAIGFSSINFMTPVSNYWTLARCPIRIPDIVGQSEAFCDGYMDNPSDNTWSTTMGLCIGTMSIDSPSGTDVCDFEPANTLYNSLFAYNQTDIEGLNTKFCETGQSGWNNWTGWEHVGYYLNDLCDDGDRDYIAFGMGIGSTSIPDWSWVILRNDAWVFVVQ